MTGDAQSNVTESSDDTLYEQVRRVINLMRPAMQSDGGDVELIDVKDDGEVRIRFHGACAGCPSSTLTLQSGIERNLKDRVPGVTSVVAVE